MPNSLGRPDKSGNYGLKRDRLRNLTGFAKGKRTMPGPGKMPIIVVAQFIGQPRLYRGNYKSKRAA